MKVRYYEGVSTSCWVGTCILCESWNPTGIRIRQCRQLTIGGFCANTIGAFTTIRRSLHNIYLLEAWTSTGRRSTVCCGPGSTRSSISTSSLCETVTQPGKAYLLYLYKDFNCFSNIPEGKVPTKAGLRSRVPFFRGSGTGAVYFFHGSGSYLYSFTSGFKN